MPAPDPHPELLVLNRRNRPVEVHVGRRVIRLGPLSTGRIPLASDRDSAQFHELIRRGVLTVLGPAKAVRPKAAAGARKATGARKAPAARKSAAATKAAQAKMAAQKAAPRTATATKRTKRTGGQPGRSEEN